MEFQQILDEGHFSNQIPKELLNGLSLFYRDYANAIRAHGSEINGSEVFKTFLTLIANQIKTPYPFANFHRRVLSPFNYYAFGLDFIRPLVNLEVSRVRGVEHLDQMKRQLAAGENVVLLSNHQTEPDPQIICLMLEKTHPELIPNMIFVAGHRVRTDPLCVPISLGINLLCIYSKRYLEIPPEEKREKILHNHQTMQVMSELLAEGGKCMWVAPSGGRDRPNERGEVEVAPFDPQSIEMFWLMARRSGKSTHFYPFALNTYALMPPPEAVRVELGERRTASYAPVHLVVGPEVNMETFPGSDGLVSKEKRGKRADYIHQLVADQYSSIL
jgi:glycerol-3-phosphate O-acyltransferase